MWLITCAENLSIKRVDKPRFDKNFFVTQVDGKLAGVTRAQCSPC